MEYLKQVVSQLGEQVPEDNLVKGALVATEALLGLAVMVLSWKNWRAGAAKQSPDVRVKMPPGQAFSFSTPGDHTTKGT